MNIVDGWLIFASLGEMNTKNVVEECQKEGWVPVLVFRDGEETIVPILDTQEKAIRFAQRNLPKNQLFGTVILTDADASKIKEEFASKKLKIEFLNHPRKMRGSPNVEIYEFFEKPDVYGIKEDMTTKAISFDIAEV